MGWIGCLGVAVSIVVLITLTSLCVVLLTKWLSCKSFWTSRIKFKQWLDLYYLSPKNWRLEDTPNRYIYGASKGYKYSYGDGYWVYIHFSFFDYLRYRLWKIGTKRRENNSKRDIRLKDVLESAQSDIERLKAQADREMEEAKRRVEETKTRISTMTTHTTSGGSGLSAHSISPISEKTNHATDLWF